jgi:ER lumen protein retaining receptor
MNVFRLAGDMTHLLSVVVLLLKIHTIKSCAGTPFSPSLRPTGICARNRNELRCHFSGF